VTLKHYLSAATMSEDVVIDQASAIPIPDDVPFDVAAIIGWFGKTHFDGVLDVHTGREAPLWLFIAEGVFEVIMALRVRPHEGWGFLLLSGIAALLVGVLIGMDLPGSAVWALGLLVGINLLFSGWSYVFLALAGRRAHEAGA
jgi:hypothetical protein